MSLTITIPGAVEATIGATAPAVLTIGVGTPGATGPQGPAGVGVPAGGSSGQYLQKTSGVDYATDWVTLPANYITSVTAPLAVTSGNLSVNLSAYAPLASPAFTGDPTAPTATFGDNDTSISTTAFVQAALAGGTAVAKNLEVYVRNQSGSTVAAGSIVYISGATGNRPLITLAQANNDANSAQTIGFVKTSIADNGFGYVIIRGELENIDTSALTEGAQLYLSPTTAGTWTTTKPSAPQHLVYVGIVLRSHPTQGTILVAVQNGFEVAELHDVSAQTPSNLDLLSYESATSLWKNKSFSTLGLLTSADAASTYAPKADAALTGNVTITTNSASPALFIEQSGTGNILTLHDQASDTTFNAIDQNGKINTIAATTTNAGFNVPHGTAPTSPVNGDVWTTTAGMQVRINGTTQEFANRLAANTFNGSNTFTNANNTFGNSTGTGTTGLASGATLSGSTKTVAIGINGAPGSTTNIAIGSTTGTSSTDLRGTVTVNTATAGSSNFVVANTAYVANEISTKSNIASPTFTGTPRSVTAAADTNTTQIATTAFVIGQASSTTPAATGTAAVGTSLKYARADHVHLNPLPTGGTAGQVLSKVDGTSYNVAWTTPSGGSAAWGAITGTLSSQTDLQSALNAKLSLSGDVGNLILTGSISLTGAYLNPSTIGGYDPGVGSSWYLSGAGGIEWNNGSNNGQFGPSGLRFGDGTTQTTAAASAPPYTNSVWAYGGWYSANVTNIYDSGSSSYYNVLTF